MVSKKNGNDIESLVTNMYLLFFPMFFVCIAHVAHMLFTFLTAFHFVCLGALTSRPAWVARAMTRPWFAGGWRSY